jgi:hypothetical protein
MAPFWDSPSGKSVTTSRRTPPDIIDTLMRQLDPDTFPYLLEHAAVHMNTSEGEEEVEFEFGLDRYVLDIEPVLTGLWPWRRRWDLNPRKVSLHTISNRADSAALALLLNTGTHFSK